MLFAALIVLFVPFACTSPFLSVFSSVGSREERVVIIDAGHGGEDGGAVAADGTKESGINLAIAEKLGELLPFLGIETVLTRTEDVSLHDESSETLRQKKVSDLKNRTAFVNGMENAVLLSIHQNSLPSDPRVRGAQAFYAKTEGSDTLAKALQSTLNEAINSSKPKSERAIYSGVYLMENVERPAVLVECGFLSNAEESKVLTTENHQKVLALAIAAGYLSWETER